MHTMVIIGCGDIGTRIAGLLQTRSNSISTVYGLIRDPARAAKLRDLGCEPILADLQQPESLKGLPLEGATLMYLAPPPRTGREDTHLRHLLASIQSTALPEKMVLLSTTAVYGDCHGEWITEQTPAHPETERGWRRLDAETQTRHWCTQYAVPYVILRVGGIYGPGRWPLERLRQGLPILKEAESPFTNRIHQDDLAAICIVAAERGGQGEIYNIADGRPGNMSGYFKAVAQAFGLPSPPEIGLSEAQQVMTPGMLSYLHESRRIDNRKLTNDLGIVLQYPDLAAGLAADPDTFNR